MTIFDELGLLNRDIDTLVARAIRDTPRDDQSLLRLHDDLTATGVRFFPIWRAHGLPRKAELCRRLRTAHLYAPNRPDGTWAGSLNPDGTVTYPVPPNRLPVVYVLRTALCEPLYVGHTIHFRARIDQHLLAGRPFDTWTAEQGDRDDETRLIHQLRPPQNRYYPPFPASSPGSDTYTSSSSDDTSGCG